MAAEMERWMGRFLITTRRSLISDASRPRDLSHYDSLSLHKYDVEEFYGRAFNLYVTTEDIIKEKLATIPVGDKSYDYIKERLTRAKRQFKAVLYRLCDLVDVKQKQFVTTKLPEEFKDAKLPHHLDKSGKKLLELVFTI